MMGSGKQGAGIGEWEDGIYGRREENESTGEVVCRLGSLAECAFFRFENL